ncbi:MAG: hypothetical protein JSS56_13030 [Proteobacteria bacterium]|nr:hypothetical protein [Pseudomonadota bacterium]
MESIVDYPIVVFAISLVATAMAALLGAALARRGAVNEETLQYLGVVQTATLTLLGLVVGFTFSMAVGRYDQRKNYEEEEANAIGTEYVRAELLPEAETAKVLAGLRAYLNLRIEWYSEKDKTRLREIDARTARLQEELWDVVRRRAKAEPTPLMTLAVSGMNDVLNTQGYTQAAWWNRIPQAAWALMLSLAVCANVLVGIGAQAKARQAFLFVLPLVVALSFLLIADIDSPRRGLIAVSPSNLLSLAQSLGPR